MNLTPKSSVYGSLPTVLYSCYSAMETIATNSTATSGLVLFVRAFKARVSSIDIGHFLQSAWLIRLVLSVVATCSCLCFILAAHFPDLANN